ncbi:DNRLRE domain-containing protein [Chitinolyticbacter albus]|uniref:DNRLRE domain-containing protein n=1 Tax=Chitinolyticbacter albus TaxID=2961951 RepID=UPI00210D9A7F|nr:DNRLRE domain-containing protein [Chitinolyticbacter albus]
MKKLNAVATALLLLAASYTHATLIPATVNASHVANVTNGMTFLNGFHDGGVAGNHLTVNWTTAYQNVGLLQFDVSSFAGINLQAQLNLYHQFNWGNGAQFGIYRNTSAWEGVTSDWASRPSFDATPAAILAINDNDEAVARSVDISTLVQGWANGSFANYGITLQRIDQDNPYVYFTSSAGSGGFTPNLTIAPVPEPETYALMGLGLIGLIAARRRKHQAA